MKPTNYTISLVIPAYNEEKYLGACLEHAIKNSRGMLHEIIVVDNASTDRTPEIARSFPGVTLVQESSKGLTKARECGYKNSTGDILAYIDADTQMGEQWIDVLISEFNHAQTSGKNLACLSGPHLYYDFSKWQRFWASFFWYILALPTYWIVGYMTLGVNFAIRRDVLEKMNGFDTSISFYGEDTDIARRASEFGKVKFLMKFYMPTSGRRLNNYGLLKMFWIYSINYLSEAFLRRPVTQEYQDIR